MAPQGSTIGSHVEIPFPDQTRNILETADRVLADGQYSDTDVKAMAESLRWFGTLFEQVYTTLDGGNPPR